MPARESDPRRRGGGRAAGRRRPVRFGLYIGAIGALAFVPLVVGAWLTHGSWERSWVITLPVIGGAVVLSALVLIGLRLAALAADDQEASESRLRALVDGSLDCVYLKDGANRWLEANDVGYAVFGIPRCQTPLSNRELAERFPHVREPLLACERSDEEAWERRAPLRVEETAPGDDGERIFDIFKVPVYHPDGSRRLLAVSCRDITEIRRLQEQVHELQKLEALGRLAGGVAHDINNIVTVIQLQSGLLRRRLPEQDPLRRCVDEIRHASDMASSLTGQLLAFSRRQLLVPRVLDLNALIEESLPFLRRLVGETIDLRVELEPGLGLVRADPGQLQQVVVNLTVNARDAMPEGGLVRVVTADRRTADGREAVMRVHDAGRGMDAETRKHIFEPFFTTKEDGGGSGLGLATVYGVVRQSGGAIEVQSAPGHGSIFEVRFPVVEGATADKPQACSAPLAVGKETVLLVEDNGALRSAARQALEGVGYEVLEAGGGEEALSLVIEEPERAIDVVVTDVIMRGLRGTEVARRLLELRPDLPVLFISGHAGGADLGGFEEAGTRFAFLRKPFTPEELARHVRALLEGQAVG